jgi:hypothetical protein
MVCYRFRLIDIINNYRHCIELPDTDYYGNRVVSRGEILKKIKSGEYRLIVV